MLRTGLPPSFGDTYDSASDSEEEDEADEDSNGGPFLTFNYPLSLNGLDIAEEYYKNDYPDEEDGDSQDSPDDSGMTVLL